MIVIPACVVCVAPSDGRVRRLKEPGSSVTRGDVVAVVDARGRHAPVHAPTSGRVGGPLTGPDQAVSRGEGVVWLSR